MQGRMNVKLVYYVFEIFCRLYYSPLFVFYYHIET